MLVKASGGGGGKGMRLAKSDEELKAAFVNAASEAEASFGNREVYVEKFIERPGTSRFRSCATPRARASIWESATARSRGSTRS